MTGRWVLAAVGALAGVSLYGIAELWQADLVPEQALLALTVFGATFFGGMLAMAGPLSLPRAAVGAGLVAAAVAGLVLLASLRFVTVGDLADAGHPLVVALLLAALPLPFWIAAQGPGWRDYPSLFGEAWGLVVRGAAAGLFAGLVWAVVFLSDALLTLVGIRVIETLIELDAVPWLVSGAVLGLALAVVGELGEVLSPEIAVRLFRILLPAVLVVVVVFTLALPVQGFARLGGLSVGGTLLAMIAIAVLLVSAAVEREAGLAVQGPVMTGAARAMAAILPLPAAMAAWAIWLRVDSAGWTPPRLAAAVMAGFAILYGLGYLAAVLRRGDWQGRLRRVNTWLAIAGIAVGALWLTPVLNAEAISARSQLARILDGRTPVERIDLWSLSRWGRSGEAALVSLRARAAEPGQEALAARLAEESGSVPVMPAQDLRAELAATLPVSPASAAGVRAAFVAALEEGTLYQTAADCGRRLPDGNPACVLVLADFWPEVPGDEALLLSAQEGGWLMNTGFVLTEGRWTAGGQTMNFGMNLGLGMALGEAERLVARLQAGPPVLRAVPLNMLDNGSGGIMLIP